MANPFSKGWKYLTASLDQKIDENADPKVQIQQATEAAKKQHQQITEQAAAVIGHQRQLEMQMDRLIKDQKSLQDKARQALGLVDAATAKGNQEEVAKYTNTAEIFASQLVAVEQQLEDTKAMYSQAQAAADQAKRQQQESEMRLKDQLGQIDELRAQADQAAMQETSTRAMDSIGQLEKDDSVPTLDDVRAKIERRYANALGAQELTENAVGGRMAEIQAAGIDMKANARLEEIRAQMKGGVADPELTAGPKSEEAGKGELTTGATEESAEEK